TLYALPTATPYEIVVTQIVEVTSTPLPPDSMTATATLTPTQPATETATETATPEPEAAAPVPADTPLAAAPVSVPDTVEIAAAAPEIAAEPAVVLAASLAGECPTTSGNAYTTIPIAGGGLDHPEAEHGDLNLALRG